MDKAVSGAGSHIILDAEGRNWMAPASYVHGLGLLAEKLSERFPKDKGAIMARKEQAIRDVRSETRTLTGRVRRAGMFGKSVIASSMQKEPLEWMGFRVIAEYGRPEAMSAREVVRLTRTGRDQQAIFVVDNLQSGPDAGKGIAETLKIPHVVLTNFPSEKGYVATLRENIDAVIRSGAGK
jgi:zinc transport system substrate-binding protein